MIVNVKVKEGDRTRVQAYEGVCIARTEAVLTRTSRFRKISYGEGVERVFPIFSPNIDSIKVIRRGKVRRAKLYYLRDRRGKSARIAKRWRLPPPRRRAKPPRKRPRLRQGSPRKLRLRQNRRRPGCLSTGRELYRLYAFDRLA